MTQTSLLYVPYFYSLIFSLSISYTSVISQFYHNNLKLLEEKTTETKKQQQQHKNKA